MYWTSEALEYLPDTPNRAHLREVILPINYFLILFSVLVHGTSISLFQATRSAIGKGYPKVKDEDPIPIRSGGSLYISQSHVQGRDDLSPSLSRATTRRQSAREYLSSHITVPSAGAARPDAYRSQLDLALQRSNSRRTSARGFPGNRTRTISLVDYDPAIQPGSDEEDTKAPSQMPMPSRARSSPAPSVIPQSKSSDSTPDTTPLEPVSSEPPSQYVPVNNGGTTSGRANRAARLEWIRRGELARGEPVSDNDGVNDTKYKSTVASKTSEDASDRV